MVYIYNPECVHILLSFELARFFVKSFFLYGNNLYQIVCQTVYVTTRLSGLPTCICIQLQNNILTEVEASAHALYALVISRYTE